ncbi:ABC-type Fe3+ transport system, substrate-binding protein [Nocardioides terrae]|uniref:ABC-type Fe3+ transport system, substrate-binding protein n=1 Tax=Nocardioides terrae TaxID=574651 RepID=A0A1I1EL49_9ACTN|nr:extracellular solute-binding protein [Nocardioides terrae]SFB85643.1 ABC-type Fe3+ transport system, substrate-binding protein [Nocardioides terrae]
MRLHHLRTAAAALAAVSLLAACGGNDSSAKEAGASSKALNYTGSDRDAYLAGCAKKEGSLTWYTSLAGDVIDDMIAKFNEAYPDVRVDTYRGDESDITSRVVEETKAGRLQGDIMELSSDAYRELAATGVMAEFSTPISSKYSDRFTLKDDNGGILGIGDRASYVSFAYNKDKIPAKDVPKTWDDLLNPALKGKIALTDSTTGVRLLGNILTNMGDEKGRAFIEKLAAQKIRIESVSGSALAGMVASGEADSSPGVFRNHVAQLTEDGNPIEWVPLEPVTANVGYAGIFKKSEHPCAAMLFTDTLLGDAGTEIFDSLQYPRPDEDLGFTSWVPDETFKTPEQYQKAFTTWQDLFESSFR